VATPATEVSSAVLVHEYIHALADREIDAHLARERFQRARGNELEIEISRRVLHEG
jgi:hypothetical protein